MLVIISIMIHLLAQEAGIPEQQVLPVWSWRQPWRSDRSSGSRNRQPFTCIMPAWGWGGGVGDTMWNEFLFQRINGGYGRWLFEG